MNDEAIKELVQNSIQVSIVKALNETPEAIDALVQAALQKEVNEHGDKPDYRSERKMPWLEWCVGEHIRNAARSAIIEAVKLRDEDIKTAIQEKINADSVVDSMIKSILGMIDREWSLEITFADKETRKR